MARGRLINKAISGSHKVHALGSDCTRYAYVLMISHADACGRLDGDPCYLRSMLYPRRDDVSEETIRGYLDAMEAVGLIRRYSYADGTHQAVQIEKFSENQPNLRPDREAPSGIPAPEPEQ